MEILLSQVANQIPIIRFDPEACEVLHEYFKIMQDEFPPELVTQLYITVTVTLTDRHFHTLRFHYRNIIFRRETTLELPVFSNIPVRISVYQPTLLADLVRMFKLKKSAIALCWGVTGATFKHAYQKKT